MLKMLQIETKVTCIKNEGEQHTFPITVGEVYDATVSWAKDIKEDGVVQLIDDSGQTSIYSTNYFEVDLTNTIEEFCSHCESYPTMPAVLGKFECPECSKKLLTCSMCEDYNCSVCPLAD